MNPLPLARCSPVSRCLFPDITDEQYDHYVHLYETSREKFNGKIASVTNMGLRNLAQGPAGRVEDYNECKAWVELELNHLLDRWDARVSFLLVKADQGKIFEV